MQQVNIHAAKTHLSALVERVTGGESFIIAKAGTPLALVIPYRAQAETSPRRSGFLKGLIRVPADFDIDAVMEGEVAAMFEGKYSADTL